MENQFTVWYLFTYFSDVDKEAVKRPEMEMYGGSMNGSAQDNYVQKSMYGVHDNELTISACVNAVAMEPYQRDTGDNPDDFQPT